MNELTGGNRSDVLPNNFQLPRMNCTRLTVGTDHCDLLDTDQSFNDACARVTRDRACVRRRRCWPPRNVVNSRVWFVRDSDEWLVLRMRNWTFSCNNLEMLSRLRRINSIESEALNYSEQSEKWQTESKSAANYQGCPQVMFFDSVENFSLFKS